MIYSNMMKFKPNTNFQFCKDLTCGEIFRSEGVALGRPPQKLDGEPYALFITISPPPKQKVKKGNTVYSYGQMNIQDQVTFLDRLVTNLYMPYFSDDVKIIGTYELNQCGNTHIHMIIWDKCIQNDYQMHALRKAISSDPITIRMTKKNKRDYMNNIVECWNPAETIEYMDKDDVKRKSINVFNFYT